MPGVVQAANDDDASAPARDIANLQVMPECCLPVFSQPVAPNLAIIIK